MERTQDELRERERRGVAGWMEGKIRERYSAAVVRLVEDRIAVVYLDGDSEEVAV